MSIETAIKQASTRVRESFDHYPTELELCRAALELLPNQWTPATILDPGCGMGPWGVAARLAWPNACIIGVDLRMGGSGRVGDPFNQGGAYDALWTNFDFLKCPEHGPLFDLVLGNPPYYVAEAFIRKSLSLLTRGGYVLYLLRQGFLASKGRQRGLYAEYMPVTVDTLAERPSFIPSGGTDATEYAMFKWQQGYHPRRYSGGVWSWKGRGQLQQLALGLAVGS